MCSAQPASSANKRCWMGTQPLYTLYTNPSGERESRLRTGQPRLHTILHTSCTVIRLLSPSHIGACDIALHAMRVSIFVVWSPVFGVAVLFFVLFSRDLRVAFRCSFCLIHVCRDSFRFSFRFAPPSSLVFFDCIAKDCKVEGTSVWKLRQKVRTLVMHCITIVVNNNRHTLTSYHPCTSCPETRKLSAS